MRTTEYKGSMGRLNVIPEFTDCKIVSPEGTVWKELKKSGYTFQSLFGADGKVVTDWVAIQLNDAPVAYDLVLKLLAIEKLQLLLSLKRHYRHGHDGCQKLIATAPCGLIEAAHENEGFIPTVTRHGRRWSG